MGTSSEEGPDIIGNRLVYVVVVDTQGKKSSGYIVGQGFGRRGFEFPEEGRRRERLNVGDHDVRSQLPRQLLGSVVRPDQGGGPAKGKEHLELADGLGNISFANWRTQQDTLRTMGALPWAEACLGEKPLVPSLDFP